MNKCSLTPAFKSPQQHINTSLIATISRLLSTNSVNSASAYSKQHAAYPKDNNNGNHENESLIQNTPNLFINDQQLALISRNDTIVPDARLTAETASKTGVLTQFNSYHESKSSIQNSPELFINEQQHAPISRNIYIVQASRLTAETSTKTGLLTSFNGNHESKSSIQTAPDLFIKNNSLHLSPEIIIQFKLQD